jgi:RNA polymerase sigma factor (sigma-70 family)
VSLKRVDGIPRDVHFQILSGRTFSEIEEQDFSKCEFLHIGYHGIKIESVKCILNNAPKLKTIRLSQNSIFNSEIKKLCLSHGVQVVVGRYRGVIGKRYLALKPEYTDIRNQLLANKDARFLIQHLMKSGNLWCTYTWLYLVLDENTNLDKGPSAQQVFEICGQGSNGILPYILAVTKFTLPFYDVASLTTRGELKEVNSMVKTLQENHLKMITAEKLQARIKAWEEQFSRDFNHQLLSDPKASLKLLKFKLSLKRYGERITERQNMIIYLKYMLGFSKSKIAEYFGISEITVSQIENKAIRKLKYFHSRRL